MKKVISVLFLTLMLGLTQAAFAQGQDQVTLRAGQQKWAANGRLKIKFISVTEDSRCPVNVECVWAGNAKVKIQLVVPGGDSGIFEFNTNTGTKANQADAYRVELVSLTPGRRSNKKIRQRDYRVTISVIKLSR